MPGPSRERVPLVNGTGSGLVKLIVQVKGALALEVAGSCNKIFLKSLHVVAHRYFSH